MSMYIQIRFAKGNIKLGNMLTFSKLMGDDYMTSKSGLTAYGTCGKHCIGCKAKCYVRKSYRYPSVVENHIRNTVAFHNDIDLSFEMLKSQLLRKRNKDGLQVRINQSGELESSYELAKWYELAKSFPMVTFYVYTKAYDYVREVLDSIEINNFYILISVWHEIGINEYFEFCNHPQVKAFVYCDGYDYSAHGIEIQTMCEAYKGGKLNHTITCDKCRKCLSCRYKVIGCEDH